MKEILEQHVKQVKEWYEDCRGNEQATKASLIAPLFDLLGYSMHDPRECKPEYRTDFGKGERAATPVDWAFLINGAFAFFVEAKEVGAKITKYAEQLGMYFAKEPAVKLGILTNGTQWRFFTDLVHENVMDTEPFFAWDVLNDDPSLPVDLLTILQKSQFKPQLIKTFAERKHHQNLLVGELNRLLEPSPEFVKLAVQNIETRALTEKRIEEWKPILANAIQEWAKQRALNMALQRPGSAQSGESGLPRKKVGKTCPSCQALVGPRTKQCKCGHTFIIKPEEAEPGANEEPEPVQPTGSSPTD
jgi:predicted type IV restriction endonuclease